MAKSTTQMIQDARRDMQDIAEFNNSSDVKKIITTRLGNEYPTLAKMVELTTDITKQGGTYSFKTIADFEVDKADVSANSSVRITNDSDSNGLYTWDGTTLTKSSSLYIEDFLINEGDNWSVA